MLGRPDVAAKGELNILAAGAPDDIARVKPVLDAIGKATWVVGSEPHLANVAKLAANFVLVSAIEAMSEAFAFCERQNVAPEKIAEILTGTLFAAPAYKTYSAAILERKFEAGFKLALGLKDVRLMLAASEKAGAPLPFASVVRDNFVDADRAWRGRQGLVGGLARRLPPRRARRRLTQGRNGMSDTNADKGPDLSRGVPLDAIAEGKMLLGHVGDEAVLLARSGGEIFAIGATCTHYNGPLAEGLIVGDTVRCPLHHACFSLRTGEALRAPALDPVPPGASWSATAASMSPKRSTPAPKPGTERAGCARLRAHHRRRRGRQCGGGNAAPGGISRARSPC